MTHSFEQNPSRRDAHRNLGHRPTPPPPSGLDAHSGPAARWPSDGPLQTLIGRHITAHFTVSGVRPNVTLQSLSLETVSELGQPLLRFTLTGTPSQKVQQALLALIAPAHASNDIDRYLNDIRTIVQTEPQLSWARTLPAPDDGSAPVKPMRHLPLEFPEFIENPAKAHNVFFCRRPSETGFTTMNGEVDIDRRLALITLLPTDRDGSVTEVINYEIEPTRQDLGDSSDLHSHLKTKLWEAMDLFWNKGDAHFERAFACARRKDSTPEEVAARLSSELTVEQRIFINDLRIFRPSFSRTTPGGAAIALEIGKRLALFSLNLKPTEGDATVVGLIRTMTPVPGFSEKEIGRLKLTANAMCSHDADIREEATRNMIDKFYSYLVGSSAVPLLHSTIHAFEHVFEIREDPWVQTSLAHRMVRGYQPCMVSLLKCPYIDEVSVVFPSMFLGYKRDGSLVVDLVGPHQQRLLFTAEAPEVDGLRHNRILLHQICSLFSQQPAVSWVDLLQFLSNKAETTPGVSFSLTSSNQFSSFPPLNDKASIHTFQCAADLFARCICINKNLSISACGMTHSGPAKSRIFLTPYGSAATLAVSLEGSAVSEVSVYAKSPLVDSQGGGEPLATVPCRIANLQDQKNWSAVVTLSKLHVEAFMPPKGTREQPGTDFRARFSNTRLAAALSKIASRSRRV